MDKSYKTNKKNYLSKQKLIKQNMYIYMCFNKKLINKQYKQNRCVYSITSLLLTIIDVCKKKYVYISYLNIKSKLN